MKRLALITCRDLPNLIDDDQLLVEALQRQGEKTVPVCWDDPSVDWDGFDAAMIRSTWDYHVRPREFDEWLRRMETVGVPLWNPAAVVRWNMDKRYLIELAEQCVDVVPTERIEQGKSCLLAEVLDRRGWTEAVVKPSISASAQRTTRVKASAAASAQASFDDLLNDGSVLVQPFVDSIATAGEWSLVFFAGEFSHAVLKLPAHGDFRVQKEHGGSTRLQVPSDAVLDAARRIVSKIPGCWLYARVDGVEHDHRLMLMELELIEPLLFLSYGSQAADRLASAFITLATRVR